MITLIRIPVISTTCTGIYLRWWFNGWHYWHFVNNYEVVMETKVQDVQVSQVFSVISKIERGTKVKTNYSYRVVLESITEDQVDGFASLVIAEKVEQYEGGQWYEVDITRGERIIKDSDSPGYRMEFEVTRKELPNTPAVFQKSQLLYIGDTLADFDDDEVIAINKQVNDIAEMQDRQSDYTASFKIRKSRAMRALFELSGEVGANTTFPYLYQTCRFIQDGTETITGGRMMLTKVDDQYYHVAIYSGNINFFSVIDKLKLTDLTLADCNHTWDTETQAATHASDLNYLYPLCEPSDDGGITPLTDDGDTVEIDGMYIWPFVKVKAIWDEIFTNAGFTVTGAILTDTVFNRLWMPIVNRTAGDTNRYLYSLYNDRRKTYYSGFTVLDPTGNIVVNGADDTNWATLGRYYYRFTGTHKVRVMLRYYSTAIDVLFPKIHARTGGVELTETQREQVAWNQKIGVFEGELSGVAGNYTDFRIVVAEIAQIVYYYDISITEITAASIGYSSEVFPHLNLPEMSQTDFIKMICNMFALVPECNPRERKVHFWNYSLLYDNIPQARDWSAYLSERDDETEFKFGNYARLNWMKYKASQDVVPDTGIGAMQVNDETLTDEKDMLSVPIATCDSVMILTDVITSRIPFNKYNEKDDRYDAEEKIDPRIVYIDNVPEDLETSPAYQKTLTLSHAGDSSYNVTSPKRAASLPVAFSSLATYYGSLAKMLTKTTLRRARFNLPPHEVAGFKHYIPIYLSQYKAYFYVNKISNYVVGKLCTIELIKL